LRKSDQWVAFWTDSVNATVTMQGYEGWDLDTEAQLLSGIDKKLIASIAPKASGTAQVSFHFAGYNTATHVWSVRFQPETIEWRLAIRPTFRTTLAPFIYSGLVFTFALVILFKSTVDFGNCEGELKSNLMQFGTERLPVRVKFILRGSARGSNSKLTSTET
jgi:hypothetical protein